MENCKKEENFSENSQKVFRPAFGCTKHPKAGQNSTTTVRSVVKKEALK